MKRFDIYIEERLVFCDSGIVDENVDSPKLFKNGIGKVFHVIGIAHFRRFGPDLHTVFTGCLGSLLQLFFVTSCESEIGSRSGKQFGNRYTDALGGSADEGDFAF